MIKWDGNNIYIVFLHKPISVIFDWFNQRRGVNLFHGANKSTEWYYSTRWGIILTWGNFTVSDGGMKIVYAYSIA